MEVKCPMCLTEFDAPHPHLTYEGFVPVRVSKRRLRTLFVRREDLDAEVGQQLFDLKKQNEALRKQLSMAKGYAASADFDRALANGEPVGDDYDAP